jgi:aerobic-type carbon monoxide dehydrogenase small subunit (CoxS/CutS family)
LPRRLEEAAPDRRFSFSVDGEPVEARAGETVAAAMLAAGRRTIRRTAKRDEPRGLYCVMGVCWECAVLIDGRTVRACVVPAAPGLAVETLGGRR